MSTSSKYANLPFIASGEKDIFETDDLPEADQVGIQQPIHDASVEIISTGVNDAFQKFAISDNKQPTKNGKEPDESYVDKFNRIKSEIDDLKSLATTSGTADIASDVDGLVQKLTQLEEIRFQNPASMKSAIVKDVDSIQVGSNIENLPLIKYELFRKPDKEQILELSKLNFLEQRIKKIENIVGINETPKDANFLNSYLKDQSIMNIVFQLSNKVIQFDHSSLEKIDSRLHSIIENLNQISERKSALENLSASDKLSELYNFYVKSTQSRQTLPNILERLQVLNDVQEQACQFSTTLTALQEVQSETKILLEKNNHNLNGLKELMQNKSEEIKQIIADFSERLDKLRN